MVLEDQMAPGLNGLKQAAWFAWGAYRHIAFLKIPFILTWQSYTRRPGQRYFIFFPTRCLEINPLSSSLCESQSVSSWTYYELISVLEPWFPLKEECCCCLVAKSRPTLCDPIDCSLPGSSVHGISQARILEWVAISFSRGTSRLRDWTHISRQILYHWATREYPMRKKKKTAAWPSRAKTCYQAPQRHRAGYQANWVWRSAYSLELALFRSWDV